MKIPRKPREYIFKRTTCYGDTLSTYLTSNGASLKEVKKLQDWANRLVAYLEYQQEKERAKKEKKRELEYRRREASTRRVH